jgi:hypothetical protein
MKSSLFEGRYAGNLEFIGKLLLEGGYTKFTDWLIEQDEARQIDVVYMMSLFAKETNLLITEQAKENDSPSVKTLKVRSPGLRGVDEAAKEIRNKPKLTVVSSNVVPIKPKKK